MVATTNISYIDIDMSFFKHPGTKDVLKKYDNEAAKQSLRNIFFTSPLEKPFDPNFGMGIERMLFEQNVTNGSIFANFLTRRIQEMIDYYEPRIIIDELTVEVPDDANTTNINLTYHTLLNPLRDSISFAFRRAR